MSETHITFYTFKRPITVSTRFKHWAIHIEYDNGQQYLYHADKESMTDYSTKYKHILWNPDRPNLVDHRCLK